MSGAQLIAILAIAASACGPEPGAASGALGEPCVTDGECAGQPARGGAGRGSGRAEREFDQILR